MSDSSKQQTDIPETLQSLLVAFAIALAFRGFVVEGFVIDEIFAGDGELLYLPLESLDAALGRNLVHSINCCQELGH